MARYKLSAAKVAKLTKPGRYGDGDGLWLQVSETGTKSWLFQYTAIDIPARPNGRIPQRQHGLGALRKVSLAVARDFAEAARQQVQAGIDPINAKREGRAKLRLAANRMTFKQCAERYIAAKASEWTNDKHTAQWPRTLATYVYRVFGDLPVGEINTPHVEQALMPIWTTKPETASRVRGRIEGVLDWAAAHGHRQGENPARWRGHLDKLLPNNKRHRQVKHHPAVPYEQIAEFTGKLRHRTTLSALALEFTILTAARSAEVLNATWNEIDLSKREWIVPARRMKARREHRVPLSDRAIEILRNLPRETDNDLLFIGARPGAGLPRNALLIAMREIETSSGYVPHGFRSTFRDWAAECTNHPSEVVEMALAHTISDKTEAAYRRGNLLQKRRALMDDWANFCENRYVNNVVSLIREHVR